MTCMVYIGLPTNSQFLRDPVQRDPDAVARVINHSRGMSGENREYLYLLERALEGLGMAFADAHISDLVKRVKELETAEELEEDMSREEERNAELSRLKSATPDEFDQAARRQ